MGTLVNGFSLTDESVYEYPGMRVGRHFLYSVPSYCVSV